MIVRRRRTAVFRLLRQLIIAARDYGSRDVCMLFFTLRMFFLFWSQKG